MEGAHLHAVDPEHPKPGAHLAGGARGEGDGQGATRVVLARCRTMRDAVGDGPCLAGACARQDYDRPMQRLGHGALLVVEPLEGTRAVGHAAMLACRPDGDAIGRCGRSRDTVPP